MPQPKKNEADRGKPRKKVSAGYLERAALHYLGRFSSSEKNLRDVLGRKIRRRNEGHAPPTAEQAAWVDEVVAKCVRFGYVNDTAYAEQRAELLLRRGKPARSIAQDLRQKGIAPDIIETILSALDDDEDTTLDRRAAAAYVKRRRFGAFRREDIPDIDAKYQKELAAMARVGFGFDLSREILALSREEISDLLV